MELKATEVRKAQQAKTAQMELTQEPITTVETATITAIITAHLSLPVAVALTFQKLQQTIITANPTHQKEMDLRTREASNIWE